MDRRVHDGQKATRLMAKEKAYITRHLFVSALEQVESARVAKKRGDISDEVRFGMNAVLLSSLTLEGAINEVGEEHLDSRTWYCIECLDPVAKWLIVSKFVSDEPFLPGEEPLQTVECLRKARNKIAHPKGMQHGNDIIIRCADGEVIESPSPDLKMLNVDIIWYGYRPLLNEFEADLAQRLARRTYNALCKLRDKSPLSSFKWLNEIKEKLAGS